MPIYISEDAFISLTLSAMETSIQYEATGLLLGYESENHYFVENAIPYQLAERTSDSAYISPIKQSRIRRIFKNYMKYRIIGEFHTHPEGTIKLSAADKQFIRERDYQLEVVVAITKSEITNQWDYKNGLLSGSIDKYFIEIGCWTVKNRRVTKLRIRCPFAVGFDFSEPI